MRSADEGAILFILGAIETNLAIICGSLPGCKPLLGRLFPRLFGSTRSYTHMERTHYALPGARISLRFPHEERVYFPPQRMESTISMESVPVKLDTRTHCEYPSPDLEVALTPVQEAGSPTISERMAQRGATSWFNDTDDSL